MAYLKDSNVSKGIIGERWLNNAIKVLGFKTHPNKLKEGEYCQTIGKRVDNYINLPNGVKLEFEMKYFGEHSNLYGSKYETQVRGYFDPRSHVIKILVITYPNVPVKRCQRDHINVFRINSDLNTGLKRHIAKFKLRKYLRKIINNQLYNVISRRQFFSMQLDQYQKYVKLVNQPIQLIKNNTEPYTESKEKPVDETSRQPIEHKLMILPTTKK